MIKAKVVDVKDLLDRKENPIVCLSPLRVFDECHKCEAFKRFVAEKKPIEKMKCKPHLNPEYSKLMEQKRQLLDQLAELNKQIERL